VFLFFFTKISQCGFYAFGFFAGTHPVKIPLKASQRSSSRIYVDEISFVTCNRDEWLDWLRNRAAGGSQKTRGCLFLSFFLLDRQKKEQEKRKM
jgi:hypothetical protein